MMYKNKINTKKFTITCRNLKPIVRFCNYIEVKEGSCWGPRFIPDYEFILVIAGKFRYKAGESEVIALKGDILCIPPLVNHVFEYLSESDTGVISCIHTEPVDLSSVSGQYLILPSPQIITSTGEYDFFHTQFKAAAENFAFVDEHNTELAVAIVKTIWLGLMKYWTGSPSASSPSAVISRICNYVKENVTEKLSRNDLAYRFNYTPEHINYLFKKELGVTPSQFINREKVLYAFRLIQQDGLSVKQASAAAGFYDQYHFSKVFKKITGRRPSDYKR